MTFMNNCNFFLIINSYFLANFLSQISHLFKSKVWMVMAKIILKQIYYLLTSFMWSFPNSNQKQVVHWNQFELTPKQSAQSIKVDSLIKMEGNSNLKINRKWKELAISKLLFPSTPYFSRDLKVEGNSNENGRK